MKYKPHEHIPLLLFGLVATPLSAMGLFNTGDLASIWLAAMLAVLGSCAAVLGIFAHFRHTIT
ncbi:MAG: hypothetical protein V1839_00435 [archaeon]